VDDNSDFADFAAREAERMTTPPPPRFRRPNRAEYEPPDGWRSWTDFMRYGDSE
jgi:hypothetical protein